MVENLINSGFYIKFGYISLAELISDKSNRLIDVANAYINEHTVDENKNFGVYCFSNIYPEDKYPLYEGNPCFLQECIRHLCM